MYAPPLTTIHIPPPPLPIASYSENTVIVVAYTSAGPGEQAVVMFRTGEDSE